MMNLTKTIGSALTLASAFACLNGAGAQDRPNILFAFGDDMGRYQSIYDSIEGGNTPNSIIKTPNFDRIAREGAVFMNAHVTAPSCTPCRSSLLSGQYFWRTGRGAILQGAVWDDQIPSYPLILKDNGYHIGRTYKVWYPGTPANAPYGGPSENKYEGAGRDFCFFSQTILQYSTDEAIASERQRLFDEVVNNFEGFLSDREEGQPFCYWWGPWNTHRPWAEGSGSKLWNINPDDLIGKLPSGLPDEPEIREDFADYLGEVLAFDYALGLIIQKLEEIGELDNTVIVVSGDHGIPGFPRAKCNLYNFGTHVPLAVRYPSMIDSGRVVEDMVNLMDLAPTFLQLGEVDIPDVMTGKSLVPVMEAPGSGVIDPTRNYVVTGRERHVASARPGNLPYPQRAIIKVIDGKQYKYIRNFKPERWPVGHIGNSFPDLGDGPTKTWYLNNYCNPEYSYYMDLAFAKRPYEELYDLSADPWEVNNLAGQVEMTVIKDELSDQLETVLTETNDPRMAEGVSVFDRLPYTIAN
ncbi:sulfatase [Saccharicrinis sp. FJH2]|uniref:sulfatase family protein n=1 Tax=Saccharicrinis sp. FJH65 TaxID=3344659 RepID=UPI0035F486F3